MVDEVVELSKKLKQLRTERGFTMEKLAEMAKCSKAYISQIEKGLVKPSVTILSRLARALGVSVSELFRGPAAASKRHWKLSKADRREIHYPDRKVVSQLLTTGVFSKKMQPIVSIIQPQGGLGSDDSLDHPEGSEEFVLVLKGEIYFKVEDQEMKLEEGDTLYFDGDLSHSWENRSDSEAEVLFMWTPPVW
jgi:transcriptional regulator with XRE-family HTH domain